MIDPKQLLADLQPLMRQLEADLIARSEDMPEVAATLRDDYEAAREAKRTAQSFEAWRTDYATQQAAAWILSGVFVRFLEDNELIDTPRVAGPGERLQHARDRHELYFRTKPTETDREYLLHVFEEVGQLPGAREVFGKHNPVFEMPNWLGPDAAGLLLQFFQRIDADTGALLHDFTDAEWDTRFLGDLYQDLSEAARKKYALLQTPEFVEEFILDRTLEPALNEFGLDAPAVENRFGDVIAESGFRMIDPACGSGHFLLGAFRRILDRWQRKEPNTNVRELVQRTLNSVNGVDVNPYAIAIARFRLLAAALKACGIRRLEDAPAFHFNLAAGDSLLHGASGDEETLHAELAMDHVGYAHHYFSEDLQALTCILRAGTFHVVVANPPYITVKDKILDRGYRERYSACHRQYQLTVPFMERIFGLAVERGYTGQITSNGFMKREFGKKLIEQFIPSVDLTHIIDTSGAYIPGHGTPTAILFGQNRVPVSSMLRTVLGIRGEPGTPNNPSSGLVWTAITTQIDQPGSESEFVSADDSPRHTFHKHPWSISGGGAAQLKECIENASSSKLGIHTTAIGRGMHTGCDESYFATPKSWARVGIKAIIPLVEGDTIRDYIIRPRTESIFPYDGGLEAVKESMDSPLIRMLWNTKQFLLRRREPNGTHEEIGLTWYEWSRFQRERFLTPLSIAFAFVATHNHFVLDRGGKVFNRSAPVIKLPENATEDDHLGLLGLLNSSTACFWMKQVFHDKGSTVDSHGARQTTVAFENFREFTATGLKQFPLPPGRPLDLARRLDGLASVVASLAPGDTVKVWLGESGASLRDRLGEAHSTWDHLRRHIVTLQEELDWACYRLYGLLDAELTFSKLDDPVDVALGQRAFEIVMARKMAAGELATTWFERHGSTPITEIPEDWPEDYKQLVARRMELIETDKSIGLIERPEYKRRWNTEPWDSQLERALRECLLGRLESYFDLDGRMNDENKPTAKLDIAVCSVAQLADVARQDGEFMEVGEVYREDPAFDVDGLVAELVEAQSVPFLPVLRYKDSGLRKRAEWERTWDLQRKEDAIDARTELPEDDPQYLDAEGAARVKKEEVGDIAVPPKYKSSDFKKPSYWKQRGKLDVPKERWVSLPHCPGQDGTLMVAWAGYDHLQQARALSAHYVNVQEHIGGADDPRLVPLLAGLIELLPWLKQWHHEMDAEFGMRMDEFFEGFVQDEAHKLGMTTDEVKVWQPPAATKKRGRRKKGGA